MVSGAAQPCAIPKRLKPASAPSHKPAGKTLGAAFPPRRGSRRSLLHGYPRPWQLSSQRAAPLLPLLWEHSRGCPSCDTSAGKEVRQEEGNKGRLHLSPRCPCAGRLCFGPQLPRSSSAPTLLSHHSHIHSKPPQPRQHLSTPMRRRVQPFWDPNPIPDYQRARTEQSHTQWATSSPGGHGHPVLLCFLQLECFNL